jgi:hypothetical protein
VLLASFPDRETCDLFNSPKESVKEISSNKKKLKKNSTFMILIRR